MLLFTLAAPLSLIDDDIIHASPSAESIQIKSLIKGSKVINFTFFLFFAFNWEGKNKTTKLFDPVAMCSFGDV